jgi:thioredoxin reductase (NADPH)
LVVPLLTLHAPFLYDFGMFDVLIIGLGAAGYTAAVYTARYKLKTLLVGLEEGGLGITAAEVGNWPGDIEIKGPDLMERFKKHALSFQEVTSKVARVEKLEKIEGGFRATMQSGETADAKSVILATGSTKRHLGVPGEQEFSGRGVTYCATCDAFFYRGKTVAVVGGGDSAVEGAAITAQVAKRVYLVHRRSQFRAEPYWVDRVKARDNVTFVLERNIQKVLGEQKVTGIRLDTPFEGKDVLPVDGVFIEIGADPATGLGKGVGCATDGKGFLQVDGAMRTSVPGVFGAGDVTNGSNHFAQFATAAGEAAVAANSAFNYLNTGTGDFGFMSAG